MEFSVLEAVEERTFVVWVGTQGAQGPPLHSNDTEKAELAEQSTNLLRWVREARSQGAALPPNWGDRRDRGSQLGRAETEWEPVSGQVTNGPLEAQRGCTEGGGGGRLHHSGGPTVSCIFLPEPPPGSHRENQRKIPLCSQPRAGKRNHSEIPRSTLSFLTTCALRGKFPELNLLGRMNTHLQPPEALVYPVLGVGVGGREGEEPERHWGVTGRGRRLSGRRRPVTER